MGTWKIIDANGNTKDFEDDYKFIVRQFQGAGMAPIENISTAFGLLDGSIFQRQRTVDREITLTGIINGSSVTALHQNRKLLINAVKPDKSASQSPFVIQYTGGASTVQASAYYVEGLSLGQVTNTQEEVALKFISYDPYFEKTTSTSATLTTQASFSASYIAQRAACGAWGALGTGTNGQVLALTSSSEGTLYAGGNFTTAGGAEACRIAQWSGTAWSKVGNAFNDYVWDLAIHPNGTLYAVGAFTTASGAAACRVAQWSGTAWSRVGNATNDEVRSIVISKTGDLYIGGDFTTASNITACRVARWNVDRWRSVGGVNNDVMKLVFDSASELYAVGAFTTASGTVTASGIAKFNLTDGWRAVGSSGLKDTADGIVAHGAAIANDGTIYVVGDFDLADGTTACAIAAWNGTKFSSVGNHLTPGQTERVFNLYDGRLLVSGGANFAGGFLSIDGTVYLKGSNWLPFDISLPFYDDVDSAYSASNGLLTVGFSLGGTACAAAVTAVTNNGTATAYPILTACAPSSSATTDGQGEIRLNQLINYTTNEAIYFNIALVAGEVVTLDLRQGKKSFTSNFRGNIINAILPGSDFATWKLLPGANNVSFWLTGGSGAARLSWVERFWSIDV